MTVVDQQARDDVRDLRHALNNHVHSTDIHRKAMREKMDEQHKDVSDKIDQLMSSLKWAGGLIVSILLSVLGWSVLQQISANEAQKTELSNQLRILQESERARLLSQQNAELSASAAEAAAASVRDGQPVDLRNNPTVNRR